MTTFNKFYNNWFDELHKLVHQLSTAPRPATTQDQHNYLDHLVHKSMTHYAEYYRVKSAAAERDVLNIFAAPWASSFERSLHWIAGWRPTTVFHLMYTESSIMFESSMIDILRGQRTGDLGDLSPGQFRRVSDLQCETVKEENAVTDELSEWQDNASELINDQPGNLDEKIAQLVSILQKADDLRLRTMRKMVELLNTQQAVEFLIAAAELQFGVRQWGIDQDRQRRS